MTPEEEFFASAASLQQSLLEMNAIKKLIDGYEKSARDFADLAAAERQKLADLTAKIRPEVVSLMGKFTELPES